MSERGLFNADPAVSQHREATHKKVKRAPERFVYRSAKWTFANIQSRTNVYFWHGPPPKPLRRYKGWTGRRPMEIHLPSELATVKPADGFEKQPSAS